MKELKERIRRPLNNERGAEIVEVGIWLALIVAISIALITLLGTDVQNAFTTITGAM
ncbi:hypothetical protein MELA_00746 [Candidatus Methylomirabilis lanthanidiphila]|uniref:Flp/Fap pilin component n=1 Tax=Candidatus Methylomirabilis lanthanidiphila TaxID=2211376 RepID=A0A564ZGE7_9BACT|nr:hypothetical protein [Candidatus Methylomirabilis lanthanidiphila]VUZ84375.1 hypothetical protein MELA_00746 [Candidatus Methylomirabilis lanthanidiphila]